jgi:hypothetical protein
MGSIPVCENCGKLMKKYVYRDSSTSADVPRGGSLSFTRAPSSGSKIFDSEMWECDCGYVKYK